MRSRRLTVHRCRAPPVTHSALAGMDRCTHGPHEERKGVGQQMQLVGGVGRRPSDASRFMYVPRVRLARWNAEALRRASGVCAHCWGYRRRTSAMWSPYGGHDRRRCCGEKARAVRHGSATFASCRDCCK